MHKQIHAISNDLGTLADDAGALLAATADVAGEGVADARKRVAAALDNGKRVVDRVKETAVGGVNAADKVVARHPYQAIGIALGAGAILSYVALRRFSRRVA